MEKTNAHSGSGYHALHATLNLASFSGSWASITYKSSSWPPETDPLFEEEPVTSIEPVEMGESPAIDFDAEKVELKGTIAEVSETSVLLTSGKTLWFDFESIINFNEASSFESGQNLDFKYWKNPDGSKVVTKAEVAD
jgi:hypothetical protein